MWLHNASNKNKFKKNLFIGMSRNIEKIIYIQKISFSFLFVHLDHQVEVCLNPEGSFWQVHSLPWFSLSFLFVDSQTVFPQPLKATYHKVKKLLWNSRYHAINQMNMAYCNTGKQRGIHYPVVGKFHNALPLVKTHNWPSTDTSWIHLDINWSVLWRINNQLE